MRTSPSALLKELHESTIRACILIDNLARRGDNCGKDDSVQWTVTAYETLPQLWLSVCCYEQVLRRHVNELLRVAECELGIVIGGQELLESINDIPSCYSKVRLLGFLHNAIDVPFNRSTCLGAIAKLLFIVTDVCSL